MAAGKGTETPERYHLSFALVSVSALLTASENVSWREPQEAQQIFYSQPKDVKGEADQPVV